MNPSYALGKRHYLDRLLAVLLSLLFLQTSAIGFGDSSSEEPHRLFRHTPGEWQTHPRIGSFFPHQDGWVYHADHAWIYVEGDMFSPFHFHDSALDAWAWTSPDLYPWIYWFMPFQQWTAFQSPDQDGTERLFLDQRRGFVVPESQLSRAQVRRVIDLRGDLAFGEVDYGESRTRSFYIHNTGNSPLTVAEIKYHQTVFRGSTHGSVIPPGGSREVPVTFTPRRSLTYHGIEWSGTIEVISDRTSGNPYFNPSGATGISKVDVLVTVRNSSVANHAETFSLEIFGDGESIGTTEFYLEPERQVEIRKYLVRKPVSFSLKRYDSNSERFVSLFSGSNFAYSVNTLGRPPLIFSITYMFR